MRKTVGLIILAVLIAINIKIRTPEKSNIDPELKPYVDQFLEYCDYYQKDCSRVYDFNIAIVPISNFSLWGMFGNLVGATVIGQCYHKSRTIEISEAYFNKSSPAAIEQVVFHELGHCILNLEHTEETKTTIMNPYSIPENVYLKEYNSMMNEFFNCFEYCPQVVYNDSNYNTEVVVKETK